jgi:signal peptidase I
MLAVVVAVLACSLTAAVAVGALKFSVVSGSSMLPTHKKGDLVVVANLPPYRVGTVAAYRDQSTGQDILHRVVEVTPSGFLMRGDNNESVDPYVPTVNDMYGREVVRVAGVGTVVVHPLFLPSLSVSAVLVVAAGVVVASRRKRARRARRLPSHLPPDRGVSVLDRDVSAPVNAVDAGREAFEAKRVSVDELTASAIDTLDLDAFDWSSLGLIEDAVVVEALPSGTTSGETGPVRPEHSGVNVGLPVHARLPAVPQELFPTHVVAVASPRQRSKLALLPALLAVLFSTLAAVASVLSLLAPQAGKVPTGERGLLRYTATVPSGATYPSGKVATGDMVFVKLVDELELVYEHQVPSGAVPPDGLSFQAELSTPGWSRELVLPPAVAEPLSAEQGSTVKVSTQFDTSVAFATLTAMGDETGVHYGAATVAISAGPPGSMEPATLTFRVTEESLAPEQMTPIEVAPGDSAVVVEVLTDSEPNVLVPRSWLRFLLLAAVVGLVVAALLWPSRSSGRSLPRNADLRALPSLHIFVDSRAAFDAVAADAGVGVVEADGWVAVVLEDRLYWTDVPPALTGP